MPIGTRKTGTPNKKEENETMNKAGIILVCLSAILIIITYVIALIGDIENRREERIKNE